MRLILFLVALSVSLSGCQSKPQEPYYLQNMGPLLKATEAGIP